MLFVLNIGNSNTAAGFFRGEELLGTLTKPTGSLPYQAAMREMVSGLQESLNVSREDVEGCAFSSVVPAHTMLWTSFLKDMFGDVPLVISAALPLGISIAYDKPSTLGTDRLCACIAAHHLYGGPAIVIDFGTATTYNLIDKSGNFLGGAISPGIMTAARSLHRNTAQLPEVGFTAPAKFPGTDTTGNLEAGIFYSAVDATKGMIGRMREVVGKDTKVVATGGLSPMMRSHLPEITTVNADLVLYGVERVYRMVGRPNITS